MSVFAITGLIKVANGEINSVQKNEVYTPMHLSANNLTMTDVNFHIGFGFN